MKRAFAALALAGTFTLLGAMPATAGDQTQNVDSHGDSAAASSGDRVAGLTSGGRQDAATSGLAGLNDPATETGIILWSLAGGGALAAGAASVLVARRRAKADANAA